LARVIDDRPSASVPLRGRVFAVKDNIDVVGLATTAACPSFCYEPAASASVVQQLVRAGAIPVGKTNMDQFATGLVGTRSPFGTPRNPIDPTLVPGGSSSGSAVAVALGLVDFALGTDTAGSGRVPAAMCGIVGVKPTLGRISCRGVVPAVRSVDAVSVFAREVWLAQEAMDHCSAFDPADPYARRPPDPRAFVPSIPRIGVIQETELVELGCTPDVVAAYVATIEGLTDGGARVLPVDIEPFFALGDLLYGGPWVAERLAAVGDVLAHGASDLDPTVASIIAGGAEFDAVDVYRAAYRRMELLRRIADQFVVMDALLLPTVPFAPTLADVERDPVGVNSALGRFTTFANLADLCAVSIPVLSRGAIRAGVGVTLSAPAWHDAVVASIAENIRGVARPVGPVDDGRLELVVAGAHLRGEPLEGQLSGLGAVWDRTTRTAPTYKLWVLADSDPPKPALVHDSDGSSIEVDVWRLDPAALGRFLQLVPAPLALGTVTLVDGSEVTGFVAEPRALDGALDITALGGWRAYDDRVPTGVR
jgi:allophanate hydrolase